MSIFTVAFTGSATIYEVYGGKVACDDYMLSMMGSASASYLAANADDRNRALLNATRFVDQFDWQGTRTGLAGGTATTLQWPRSGIVLGDGSSPDSVNVPAEVVAAVFELAAQLAADPDLIAGITDDNVRSVSDGAGTSVAFFDPARPPSDQAALPFKLARLIAKYLASAGSGAPDSGYSGNGGDQSAFSESADNVDPITGAVLGPAKRTYPY